MPKTQTTSSFHYAAETLKQNLETATLFFVKENKQVQKLKQLIAEVNPTVKLQTVSEERLQSLSVQENTVPFVFEFIKNKVKSYGTLKEFITRQTRPQSLVLVLDGISDVHNLGAILRSADAFAVDLVILPKNRAATVNETVRRTSAGAYAWVPMLTVANLAQAIKDLQGAEYWVYGSAADGDRISDVSFSEKTVLVLGSEDKGLRELTRKLCDFSVAIPMMGHIDSLNVSVAAGICCHEVRRQQATRLN